MSEPLTQQEMDDFERRVIQVLSERPDGRIARAISTIAGKVVNNHVNAYHGGNHSGTMPMGGYRTLGEIEGDLEIEEP